MTNQEAREIISNIDKAFRAFTKTEIQALEMSFKALEQEPCEMTAEEYRQRMIQAFHNADCGELIALVVLPTEKEFEHLEWLLKNHYKKEPCEDAISRQAMHIELEKWITYGEYKYSNATKYLYDRIDRLPSVNPQEQKTGRWINAKAGKLFPSNDYKCSECDNILNFDGVNGGRGHADYCPNCGCRMIEPQESEE